MKRTYSLWRFSGYRTLGLGLHMAFFLLFSLAAAAQNTTAGKDSLESLKLSFQREWQTNPAAGLKYAKQAIALAKELEDPTTMAKYWFNAHLCYRDLFQPDSALLALHESSALFKTIGNNRFYGQTLLSLGDVYCTTDALGQAKDYYLLAADVLKNEKPLLHKVTNGLGVVYGKLNQPQEALRYLNQSLTIIEELGDLPSKGVCLTNIGNVYLHQEQFKQALPYFLQAVKIRETVAAAQMGNADVQKGIIDSYRDAGATYLGLKKYPEAKKYLDLSLSLAQKEKDHFKEVNTLWLLAEYHTALKELPAASSSLEKSKQLVSAHKITDLKKELYKRLAAHYKLVQEKEKALQYLEQHTALADSLQEKQALEAVTHAVPLPERKQQLPQEEPATWPSHFPDSPKGLLLLVGVGVLLSALVMFLMRGRTFAVAEVIHPSSASAGEQLQPIPVSQPAAPEAAPAPLAAPALSLSPSSPAVEYVQALKQSGEVLVPIDKVYWFETKEKCYYLSTGDDLLDTQHTIAELEEMLQTNKHFIRINRSVIINIHHMFNYSPWEKDKFVVRMSDPAKTEFIMPRSRLKLMLQKLGVETVTG